MVSIHIVYKIEFIHYNLMMMTSMYIVFKREFMVVFIIIWWYYHQYMLNINMNILMTISVVILHLFSAFNDEYIHYKLVVIFCIFMAFHDKYSHHNLQDIMMMMFIIN